jgi:hypothetical protein
MTIVYRILLILVMTALSLPLAAQEQPERRYRVEMIVVRHLSGSSDPTPQTSLRDHTELLDLYAPAPEHDSTAKGAQADTSRGSTPASSGEVTLAEASQSPADEPMAIRIDDMSDTMRETWRRLRGSAGFRPELFRAWEQSGNKPFPELRIHDDELLYEIDPSSSLGSAPVDEHGALVFSDQTFSDQAMPDASGGSTLGDDGDAPPMQYYYRIDGTAQLTRSRFLHLELDVELREPLYHELAPEALASGSADSPDAAVYPENAPGQAIEAIPGTLPADSVRRSGPAANATAFRIHRIAQKRQVKTEQMEYFDGPVIGLLVLVTGFDAIADTPAGAAVGDGMDQDPAP